MLKKRILYIVKGENRKIKSQSWEIDFQQLGHLWKN